MVTPTLGMKPFSIRLKTAFFHTLFTLGLKSSLQLASPRIYPPKLSLHTQAVPQHRGLRPLLLTMEAKLLEAWLALTNGKPIHCHGVKTRRRAFKGIAPPPSSVQICLSNSARILMAAKGQNK